MKDGSFLTKAMDLPPENGSHDNDVNGEKEFSESSGYIENIEEDAKPKDNVNTTALQWPLRHNSDTSERNSYGWNSFRRRKTPRCTTNGRISRIPSRYLSSDSDSSDGSARKDMAPRLKVKRRRKSSGNKLRINGCNERQDKLTVKLTEIHRDGVICDRKEGERLDYSECQEVFVQTSPISDDTISGIAHEAQTTGFFEVNKSLTEALKSPETLLKVKLGEMLDSKSDSKSGLGLKKTAVCCLKATGGCVDISSENKRRPRINSSMESTQQNSAKKLCDQETAGTFKRRKSVECSWTTDVSSVVCSEEQSKEKTCDSSTEVSFVSSIQNSKQNEVSCASSGYNDCKVPLQKGNNDSSVCKTPAVSTVANGCLSSDIVNGEETTCLSAEKLDYVKEHAVLSEPCPEKKRKSAKRRFVYKNKTKEKKGEDFGFKPAGLNCFRNNCKMKRRYAKKLNQKQIRTTVKANGGSGLKKQGLIRQLKQKSVDKVKKVVKLPKRINNKVNNKKAVLEVKPVKSSLPSQELDRVLGMRKNSGGIYEFLVQWTNGTSCWVSSDQIVTNQHNCILRDYLIQNDQDISVINRIPFQAYCCDSLSLNECKTVVKLKQEKKKTVVKPPPVAARKVLHDKQEVSVENDGDYCYITLRRETCLRKLTCMKIITEFIAALEDASVSDSKMVIVRGLGSKVFVGLTLDSIYKASAQEKGNVIVLKARYLVQTLTNYPKLLVALISKPAEGIGAVFLSLFDMICSEEAWNEKKIMVNSGQCSKNESFYSLPRVKGNLVPCEEILMGKNSDNPQPSCPLTPLSTSPDAFFDDLARCGSSTVMTTLKEIERTIQSFGKKPSIFGVMDKDILSNQASDCFAIPEAPAAEVSVEESTHWNPTSINDLSIQASITDSSYCESTGSAPVDRYVKELKAQIFAEKEMVQKYYDEITNIWNDLRTVSWNDES